MDLSKIVSRSLENLKHYQEELAQLKLQEAQKLSINVHTGFKDEKTIQRLNKMKNVIYMLYVKVSRAGILNLVVAYEAWKREGGSDVHSSQLNSAPPAIAHKLLLYVGSKRERAGTRFLQHIGTANKGTYSLHLKEWLPNRIGSLNIHYYCFGETMSSAVLQILEDSIWDEGKPLFGKRGAH
jgi:hypothetical protein